MTELTTGANAPLPETDFGVMITLPSGADIDVTALLIYPEGKVRGDGDMVFYGQLESPGGAVRLTQGVTPRFDFFLNRVPSDVEKIVLTATAETGKTFGQLGDITLEGGGHRLVVAGQGRSEAALILAEVYKRNGQWKIRNVGQGFNGGLAQLATHFGVEIAEESPSTSSSPQPDPQPAKSSSVNLSKVSLTKQDKAISLKKESGKFGKIRINLNWNQGTPKKSFFGISKGGIDLDLGAFVEIRDGTRGVIQALGNTFGNFDREPFVKLMGDDRTGSVSDGEWLEINGDHWHEIQRVLIYAFIYEGVANWQETDGVVRVLVPDQPEIEIRMNEYGSKQGTCAVVELINEGGAVRVERKVEFFAGQKKMDEAYGWGFRWSAGRK